MANRLSETLLEKTDYSFVSEYPLQRASCLGVGALVLFLHLELAPIWLKLMQALCILALVLWLHMCISPSYVFRTYIFLGVISSRSYSLSASSSAQIP